ncbi:MAG: amidophosphoribosyltransferase [Vampirovibrionales bacterium]
MYPAPITPLALGELHEKCAVFGLITPQPTALGQLLYLGLFALQHRGQESCGMACFDGNTLHHHKNTGLVSQVFNENNLEAFMGRIGIGHNRYSTAGDDGVENAQPVVCRSRLGDIALAHNGNLFDLEALRHRFHLEMSDALGANSDSHVMARCLSQALFETQGNLLQACVAVLREARGAFSVLIATPQGLIAARDTHGIRPLSLGQTATGAWVFSSETAGLDIVGASHVRDIRAGEVVMIDLNGQHHTAFLQESAGQEHFCAFEYVYFARPDSMLHGQSVYEARLRMGQRLAEQHPVTADYVVPVPDSGIPAAMGYSQHSGIPVLMGLVKNRYVGRTFINPTEELREQGIRLKLNPISSLIKGKRVVVIDDSIVRGTTSRRLVQLLIEAGASEVHLRISSPPVKHPCFYGIDMSTEAELIANRLEGTALAEWLGADSLCYLTPSNLAWAIGTNNVKRPCMACFTKHYPAGQPSPTEQPFHHSDFAVV